MNGSKMYLEGDTYRERIPKPIKTIIIVFHVLASLLLLSALIFSINVGILYVPVTLIPIWFLIAAIVLYFVASGTLDAGFNRFNDKALGATPAMLWLSILFCGLVFLIDNRIAAVAISGGALMFFESMFVFVAYACATERKRKYLKEQRLREQQKLPKDFIPVSMQTATGIFFILSWIIMFVTMVLAFHFKYLGTEIWIYEKTSYYSSYSVNYRLVDSIVVGWNDTFRGVAALAACLIVLAGGITYAVGCKRNNKTLAISFLLIVAAQLIMCGMSLSPSLSIMNTDYYEHLFGNYYYKIGGAETLVNNIIGIMSWVCAGLLAMTFMFVFISWRIAHTEQKRLGRQVIVKM